MNPLILALALASAAVAAQAADLKVFSAGAVEPGMASVAQGFQAKTGHTLRIEYMTAPVLRDRGAREAADIIVAPPPVLAELAQAGRLGPARASLGRVGIGAAVRKGAPRPDIASEAGLKAAVLAAQAVIFNRASSGQYLEGLFQRIGVGDQVAAKAIRPADGEAVYARLGEGQGAEIGFGPVTEIEMHAGRELDLVGALPGTLQNYTAYAAAPTAVGDKGPAGQLLAYLASADGRKRLADAGIEAVP